MQQNYENYSKNIGNAAVQQVNTGRTIYGCSKAIVITNSYFTRSAIQAAHAVNVMLWAYNPYMCFDTTTITVYVDHTTLWIPNAFTPEESTNNTFLVKMNDIQRYHIFIYDRRGQLVFESYDPEQAWDGKAQNGEKCPQGVYTYLISCHKITYPFDQIVRKGTVVLIR